MMREILLVCSWVFYLAMIVRQMRYVFGYFRDNPSGKKTMLQVSAVMAGLIGVSAFYWATGRLDRALWISAGPPAIIGGGYALVFLMFVIFGKSSR